MFWLCCLLVWFILLVRLFAAVVMIWFVKVLCFSVCLIIGLFAVLIWVVF